MQDNSSDTTLNRSRMTVADFVSSRLHGSLYAWRSGSGFSQTLIPAAVIVR
jgi:hypothetical protein